MEEKRGSIAFFATYRPPMPLDIFSCPLEFQPTSNKLDELHLTDGNSYNYNAQVIPPAALKTILKRPQLASEAKEEDVDSGRVSGLVFVSERGEKQLETLHIALRFNDNTSSKVKVFSLADVFGTKEFSGVRMEDSGCIAGDYLVYVSTKVPAPDRRQPWTAVYKTNLNTGKTERLTPEVEADLSPSVSPSGKMIAVASFQNKGNGGEGKIEDLQANNDREGEIEDLEDNNDREGEIEDLEANSGWEGEIEDLHTNIYVMNVQKPLERRLVVVNGGWPTWGSDNVIFFHRKVGDLWGVFRADVSKVLNASSVNISHDIMDATRVTPDDIDARTPAAINDTKVAVATIRKASKFSDVRDEEQYRHIEVFEYSTSGQQSIKLTRQARPKADHYNPFVIDGGKRIGYHRCKSDHLQSSGILPRQFQKLESPHPDVGMFRVSGVFPSFSNDGSKLAFVDNEFKAVWIADSKGLRTVYNTVVDNFFSPVWNQDPKKDILYVCVGRSFSSDKRVDICIIRNVSSGRHQRQVITKGANNAFPSTNPDGTKLVFRSNRDDKKNHKHKNLYIMDAKLGEYADEEVTRLTEGDWIDTHCHWSPRGDWIAFSSTRDKRTGALDPDKIGLDPGSYAVYLVKWNDPRVVVRVLASAKVNDHPVGHVTHPFFSPDGKSLVVTADIAAVSVDPVSLPLFVHSVRPYGDIFTVDIDPDDIYKNKDVENFKRITHSRYEYGIASWTTFSTQDPNAKWNLQLLEKGYKPTCPYAHPDGGESWHMTGHLCIPKRCC